MNTDCINFFKHNQYNLLDIFDLLEENTLSSVRKKLRKLSLVTIESTSNRKVFSKCFGLNQVLDLQIEHNQNTINKLSIDVYITDNEIANELMTYVLVYYYEKLGEPETHLANVVWALKGAKKIVIKKLRTKHDKGLQIACLLN